MAIVSILMINATAGFWYCEGHATGDALASLHRPGHRGCPPGSHRMDFVTERGTDQSRPKSSARWKHPVPIENRGLVGAAAALGVPPR
jgi:hypothetical protein